MRNSGRRLIEVTGTPTAQQFRAAFLHLWIKSHRINVVQLSLSLGTSIKNGRLKKGKRMCETTLWKGFTATLKLG